MPTTRNRSRLSCYSAGFHRLKEFFRDDGLRIALALNGKFVQVHRIGNIDRDDEFDVDGRLIVLAAAN